MKNNVHKKIQIPSQIWILGLVSFFSDVSTEMVYGLLPVYVITVLGASASQLGVMEGIAESFSLIIKVFSGALSDAIRNRKWLTTIGYGVAAISKPLFPLAQTFSMVFGARLMDRLGKGIRGAPRDALIAFHSPPEIRGASFGLRQSLDNAGSVLGPLIAVGLMALFHSEIKTVMWIAVVPVWFAVLLLIFFVREPSEKNETSGKKFHISQIKKLSSSFWILQICIFILMFAKFSDVFLVLKAKEMGWSMGMVPMVMVIMNVVYTLFAYPMGSLSDRVGRYRMIVAGACVFIFADIALAFATNFAMFLLGVSLWGIYLGCTQGVFSAVVVDLVPDQLRGTCLGIFQCVCGIALLCSSSIAGYLWETKGSHFTFLSSAVIAIVALVAFAFLAKAKNKTLAAN